MFDALRHHFLIIKKEMYARFLEVVVQARTVVSFNCFNTTRWEEGEIIIDL